MFNLKSRSQTMGTFDPAMLCRKNTPLVTVMPALPKEVTIEIRAIEKFESKDLEEKVICCLAPAIVAACILLAFIAPLPQ